MFSFSYQYCVVFLLVFYLRLSIPLQPAQQKENHENQQNHSHQSGGRIAPRPAIAPSGNHSQKGQDQNDNQYGAETHFLRLSLPAATSLFDRDIVDDVLDSRDILGDVAGFAFLISCIDESAQLDGPLER